MNYDLNNNSDLITFLGELFKDQTLSLHAPLIMKFFIITRNYGLINYQENINKICNNENFIELCLETIKNGFKKDNITYNNDSLIGFLIKNYHDNGFYFYSFPGVEKESITRDGIVATRKNESDDKYYEIIDKYHIGPYFRDPNNGVSVTEMIDEKTNEKALFAPEWLEMVLKQGNHDIHDAYVRGDVREMQEIADNALIVFRVGMVRNPDYSNKDCDYLAHYIKEMVNKRFKDGNNEVCIALIEKRNSDEYFKKHIHEEDQEDFSNYVKSHKMTDEEIFQFVIESLSNKKLTTDKSIPSDLIRIISYQVNDYTFDDNKRNSL